MYQEYWRILDPREYWTQNIGVSHRCEALFDQHGYAPLEKFFAMEGGREAFGEYAEVPVWFLHFFGGFMLFYNTAAVIKIGGRPLASTPRGL